MMTAVLFSSPVQRFVVDVQEKSSIDVQPDADNDGIRRDSAWWVSSPWKRSVADLDPHKSLAVLGEPGVGKSTTIAGLVGDGPSVNYVHLDEAADVRLLRELLEPTVSATLWGVPHWCWTASMSALSPRRRLFGTSSGR
jgi:hypothetical protein